MTAVEEVTKDAEAVRLMAKNSTKTKTQADRMGRMAMYRFLNRRFKTERFKDGRGYIEMVKGYLE